MATMPDPVNGAPPVADPGEATGRPDSPDDDARALREGTGAFLVQAAHDESDDGASLLDMDAGARRRWVRTLLQLPDVDADALEQLMTEDAYDAQTLKKVRAALRGAQSKLKARQGNLVTRVASRVVAGAPTSTGRASRLRSFLRACDAAGLQYLLLAFALIAAGSLFVASVELPHEVRTMARWRKEAVRSWKRQPWARNSTHVADWFFHDFESKEDGISTKAQSRAELAPRDWRCGGCQAVLQARHVLRLTEAEAGATCATGLDACGWQLTAAFHFVVSLFTTIGYGAPVTPATPLGQILVVCLCVPGIVLVAMFIVSLATCARTLLLTLNRRALQDRTERAKRAATIALFALAMFPVLYIGAFAIYAGTIMPKWSGWECVYFAFVSVSTVGLGDYALEKPGIGAALIVVLGCASWAVTLGLVQDTIGEREYVLATLRDRLRDMRGALLRVLRRARDDLGRRRREGLERPPSTPLPRMMTELNPMRASAPAPGEVESATPPFEDVALDEPGEDVV